MATTAPNVLTSEMQTKLASEGLSPPISHLFSPPQDLTNQPSRAGANSFVEAYYHTLNSPSRNLAQFYTNSNAKYTSAQVSAQIVVNGSPVADPAAYTTLVAAQGADIRYDVESFDTHVVNPAFAIAAPENTQPRGSILVQVTGKVSFGKGRDMVKKAFSEVFILVPNWDAHARNAPKNLRRFLIMSQNYRSLMD
ncbi:hypothetical protein TD95_003247 [Thielaviopsis punctulata]|uniref:NTF2 domain-containing protein n=1 Tax=Thielaviopsis punctulata TaxID=72032 RepID=A0A0F4ZCJ4_9PEZI|nr:hypothetical protein TD95_003247 [Thielaviopsis punctulata]